MTSNLYVLFLKDGNWALCAWDESADKQNIYYVKGGDAELPVLITDTVGVADPGIESKELLADISGNNMRDTVQKTLHDCFSTYMCSPQVEDEWPYGDCEDCEDWGDWGDYGGCERFGSWSQTFVILGLQELEHDDVVRMGTAEKYHRRI
jgi:hypothetical protein